MNATIDREHFRTLTHAVASLGRTSEYIAIQGTRHQDDGTHRLRLSALNRGQTAFVSFNCYEDFFESIHIRAKSRRFDITLNAKTLLAVLRHQNTKQIHACELELVGESEGDDDNDEERAGFESRFVIRLYSSKNFLRSFKLTYESKPGLFPRDSRSEVNRICIKPKSFQELLDHFPTSGGPSSSSAMSQGEVSMECASEYCMIKSRTEDHGDRSRCLETNVMVEPAAFDLYDIGDPKSKVMFGLRDFKNAIMLADTLKYSMYLSFHRGGQPISIEIRLQDHGMQQPVAMAQFTIATSEPDEASNEEIAQHQERRQEALNEQRRKERDAEAVQAQRQQQANGHAQQERDESSSASMVAEGQEAVGKHNGPVQSTLMAEKEARKENGASTAQGGSERAKPLFREDATSSSQGSVPPSQQPLASRMDEEAHDTFDDEFADNDADLQHMQELEESIQRGEIVPRGSQGSQLVPPPPGHSQRDKTAEPVAGEDVEQRREAASTEPTSAPDSLSQQRRTIQRVGFVSPVQEDNDSRIEPAGDNVDNEGEKANEEEKGEENGEEEAESDYGELQDYSESARIAKRRREMMLANDSLFQDESMGTSEGGEEDGGEDLNEEELGATDDEGEADEDEDLLSAGGRAGANKERKRNPTGGSASRTQSYRPLFPE